MTLGDLNYLLLSGKRQEWLASVNNLLGEAEQFFEIHGDEKARSFVHALSANPVQWMVDSATDRPVRSRYRSTSKKPLASRSSTEAIVSAWKQRKHEDSL